MKKTIVLAAFAGSLMLSSCGTGTLSQLMGAQTTSTTDNAGASALNTIASAAANPQTLGNMLQSVLGLDKMTQTDIIGTWKYAQPGCAFTSEQLLAQAGGEVAATAIKQKLAPTFKKIGVKPANTYVTFNQDGTFVASFAGKAFQGNYTYDASTSKVVMQGLLLNMTCYAKKNSDGIALLFEASKLLTMMQTLSALSGNQNMQAISSIAGSYNGLRVGFDMTK